MARECIFFVSLDLNRQSLLVEKSPTGESERIKICSVVWRQHWGKVFKTNNLKKVNWQFLLGSFFVDSFYYGPDVSRAMVMWPPIKGVTGYHLTEQTRTKMSARSATGVMQYTVSWLSHDCLRTASWLSHECIMTVSWLSHDAKRII